MAPLLPTAFGRMPLEDATVVISSTSAFAHHVRPPDDAVHIAYCHAPPHFLWDADGLLPWPGDGGMGSRAWARRPASRRTVRPPGGSTSYVANSAYTAERIREAYDLDATVVYPPVDTAAFAPDPERSGRFLVVARLRRHKRIDLAVEAATRHGWPLDVIGEGPDEARPASRRRPVGPVPRPAPGRGGRARHGHGASH